MPPQKSKQRRPPARSAVPAASPSAAAPPETVDPRWILKALAATVAVGLFCAYLAVCILFYVGQAQLVLHPSRTVSKTPAGVQLPFQPVRFGPDITGQPQLAGWWIPSDLASDPTALVLHGQDGSMSDALAAASVLHDARLNVLLFDYRGYGESSGRHPTEHSMQEDAAAALAYLRSQHHVEPSSLVVYGTGLGASLAVDLCERNPAISGLILVAADGDTETRVLRDERSRIVPVRLLFHNRFPLADPLHTLRTPKLLISTAAAAPPIEAQRAADPKITVELPADAAPGETTRSVRRFLDTYVMHPVAPLVPAGH